MAQKNLPPNILYLVPLQYFCNITNTKKHQEIASPKMQGTVNQKQLLFTFLSKHIFCTWANFKISLTFTSLWSLVAVTTYLRLQSKTLKHSNSTTKTQSITLWIWPSKALGFSLRTLKKIILNTQHQHQKSQ